MNVGHQSALSRTIETPNQNISIQEHSLGSRLRQALRFEWFQQTEPGTLLLQKEAQNNSQLQIAPRELKSEKQSALQTPLKIKKQNQKLQLWESNLRMEW